MPRTLIRPTGATRDRSLGWLCTWWIETFVVHGPGDVEGQPIEHGDEYTAFFLDCYALGVDGRRLVNSAFLSRPKGCNKSGFAAEITLFEALGPSRFDGWAEGGETYEFLGHVYTYQPGEAMGRPVNYPMIRLMATEEGQVGNVYDMVYNNLMEGPLSQLQAYGMQVGKGQILLPEGGKIMPSNSGAASKDGGKETFVVFDETHLYNTNGLRTMYKTVTRNLVKRRKSAETWYIETTTMYDPGEDSIAKATYEYADLIKEKKVKRAKMLYDHRWADISDKDMGNEKKIKEAIREAYGDAMDWNSEEGVMEDIFDPRRAIEESKRYFLNAPTSASNSWLKAELVRMVTAEESHAGVDVADGEEITLGFDGAVSNDATALVACRISDGYCWPILIEECPDGPEAKDWLVDTEAFDAAVAETFKRYKVLGFYADPPYWADYIDAWEAEFGEGLRAKSHPRSAIKWFTKRDNQMALALDRVHTAIQKGTISIGNSGVLIRHMLNARIWKRRGGDVIGKATTNSKKKIDGAMALALAFEARAAVLRLGEEEEEEIWVPKRIR